MMSGQNDEHEYRCEPEEQPALYAAGALTPRERLAFEAHLATGCARCRDEVDAYASTTAALIEAVPQAEVPPSLRATLLARIAAEPVGTASPLLRHVEAEGDDNAGLVIRRGTDADWEQTDVPGVSMRILFVDHDRGFYTAMVRMAPGASYPSHVHGGPEECLVLEGRLRVGSDVLDAGDYQRAASGSRHPEQRTDQGCLLLITSSFDDVFEG